MPALSPRRRDASVLLTGVVLLVIAILLRQTLHGYLALRPALAITATLLVFAVPGAVVGWLAPARWLVNGPVLGVLAGCFIAFKGALPSAPTLALVEAIAVFAVLAALCSSLGALCGSRLRTRSAARSVPPGAETR